MKLKEVLAQVPGLQKRFVHYVESQGYIQPAKVHKRVIAHRDYGSGDVAVLREMWRYCRQGYSVQAAYDLVARRQRCIAFVLFPVPKTRWAEALAALHQCPEVLEASAVYGSTIDFIVRSDTPQEGDIFQALMPVLGKVGSVGSPTILRVDRRGIARPAGRRPRNRMMAYILMKVPGKDVERVLEEVRAFPEVVEASTTYGESDMVLKVSTPDQEKLDDLVMRRLHAVPGVESTRTFITVGGMHWSRSSHGL